MLRGFWMLPQSLEELSFISGAFSAVLTTKLGTIAATAPEVTMP